MTVLSRKSLNMYVCVFEHVCISLKWPVYVCVCVCAMCVSMAPLREASVVASHSTSCRLWFNCGPPPVPTFGTQRKYTRGTHSHCFLDPSFIGLCTCVFWAGVGLKCARTCVIVRHYVVLSAPNILKLFGSPSCVCACFISRLQLDDQSERTRSENRRGRRNGERGKQGG